MSRASSGNMADYLTQRWAAQRRDWLVSAAAVVGALALLVVAGLLIPRLNTIRRECQLVLHNEDVRGLPPDIALMTKTGTLRGLAIDIGFIRLENLKQQNRFYELMQLSDWLCKLAPRYAAVWSYSAWNMAYNISVCQYTPEARWMWVRNGIENIRNRGLRYNPKAITLYKELAWIIWHKVGDKLDDFHMEYKKEMAVEMERILGEPPLATTEEEAIAAFRSIVEAPRDLDAWLQSDPEAAALRDRLRQVGLDADAGLLEFAARHLRTYTRSADLRAAPEEAPTGLLARQKALLEAPENAALLARMLAALRSAAFRDQLNMDVDWMLRLMEDYGPLDWRSPFAHSLYWATYGDMVTRGVLNIEVNDSMNAVRFIFFSLANMFRSGKMMLEPDFARPNRSFLQMLPDSRYIRHLHAAYLHYGKEQFKDDPQFREGTSGPNYWAGHKNFLLTAIRQLYFEGTPEKLAEARDYYTYLRDYDLDDAGRVKLQYLIPFDQFVLQTIYEGLETSSNAQDFIAELLLRSLINLSNSEGAAAVAHFNQARKAWHYYMRDMSTDRNTRRMLEPIGVIRRDVTRYFLQSFEYSLLQKHRMWQNLDTATRQAVYDDARPWIERYCAEADPPMDSDKVLPEPPGMEEHRADPDRVLRALQRFGEESAGEKMEDQ